MKAELKPGFFYGEFDTRLSEQLRAQLELKIDKLYQQDQFKNYTKSFDQSLGDEPQNDILCTYLVGNMPQNYPLSGKLLQGIKTWFNMYNDDRLSVISKFRLYYYREIPSHKLISRHSVNIVFCKFLINELLKILAENRWQPLIKRVNLN